MAGIGFKLKKLFKPDTFIDNALALIFSTTVASGPIFFSLLCLGLLGIFVQPLFIAPGFSFFLITIVYIVAFSLITTGTMQLVLSRYLADKIYGKEYGEIMPALCMSLALTVVWQALFGLPFLLFLDADFLYRITAFALFVITGCIWQLMVFLSAVKKFRSITFAFGIGVSISFGMAWFLSEPFGVTGLLHGYALGQMTIFFILLARVLLEFKSAAPPSLSVFNHFKLMPQLIIIGAFYNLGIWIDKMIFWFSAPTSEHVNSFLYASSIYDTATYLAYVTVLPSATYFLVKIETDFYDNFRSFFHAISNRETFKVIEIRKKNIAKSVRESLIGLLKIQGCITLLCLFYSEELVSMLHISSYSAMVLEKALVAVFLQMIVLTLIIFMMYFDIKGDLIVVTTLFLVSNALFTALSIYLGPKFHGYGYLFSNLLTLLVALAYINRHLQKMEYRTFMQQVQNI